MLNLFLLLVFLSIWQAGNDAGPPAAAPVAATPSPTQTNVPAKGKMVAVLRNGYSIYFDRKVQTGNSTRLYTETGYLDIATDQIEFYEDDGVKVPSTANTATPTATPLTSAPTVSPLAAPTTGLPTLMPRPSPPAATIATPVQSDAENHSEPGNGIYYILFLIGLGLLAGLGNMLRRAIDMQEFVSTIGTKHLPSLAVIILLLIAAFGRWPYALYVLLRFAVCALSIYLVIESHRINLIFWTFVFGATAVLFNPLVPLRMSRGDWKICNFVAVGVFGVWIVLAGFRAARVAKQAD